MTQLQISTLLLLNTAMLVALVIIAFRLSQGYNIFVKQSANHTPAPLRTVDEIEVDVSRSELSRILPKLKRSGYEVVRSQYADGMFRLLMTKTLNGDQVR